ncbi:hypothetical protein HRbin19_01461 [bacterium HR19]|nr:hypothetical protein HRbin19_01461 [bacterium HR19]
MRWKTYVDTQRKVAYVASGFGLRTFDVSNPYDIKFLGVIGMPKFCRDVKASGSIALVVCDDSGLRIVDVSDPKYPREISFYITPAPARGIFIKGTIAYIADDNQGLHIVDFSNPFQPRFLGWLDTPGSAWNVFVKDNIAYVADRNGGLRIIDVSDPTNPTEITSFATPSPDYLDVYVQGQTAYVADSSGIYAYLRVIDVSNPAFPNLITTVQVTFNQTDDYTYLAVKGNYVFYSEYMRWDSGGKYISGGVHIIDFSAGISNPVMCNEITEPQVEGHGIFIPEDQNILYFVWDWQRFATFDISNPCSPSMMDIWFAPGDSWGVYVRKDLNLAFVGDWRGGVRIINITDLSFPYEITYYDTPGDTRGLVVVDHPSGARIVYAASGAEGGLRILDVTNPNSPTEVSFFMPWTTGGDGWDVFVKDATLAFFAAGNLGLFIIDASNYNNPVSLGWIDTPGFARGVYVQGNTAYVADGGQGLMIIDVTNPSNPVAVTRIATSNAIDVFVSGNTAYVADAGAGIRIIDVTNPGSPSLVSTFKTTSAFDVWVKGGIAFVADFQGGVTLIDVSNPAFPKGMSYFITSSDSTEIMVVDGVVFTANRFGGLMIFTFVQPQISVSPTSLNFGDVRVGEYKELPIDIQNTGQAFMVVRDIIILPTGGPFRTIGVPPLPFSIEPGKSQTIYIRFSPEVIGSISGNVFISSDGGSVNIPLYGNGTAIPSFSVSPTSITFGNVPVNTYADRVFRINNSGPGTLRVSNLLILGEAFSFVNPPSLPIYVSPGTYAEIAVRFYPSSLTNYEGSIAIETNGGNTNVLLSGRGIAPLLSVSPTSLDFGGVDVGSSRDMQVSLSNIGEAQLRVDEILISGTGFSLVNPPSLPIFLNPASSVSLSIRFSPTSRGTLSGKLIIVSNGGSKSVLLSGQGFAPVLSITPSEIDFGGVERGTSKDMTLNIRNTGESNLEISNLSISGEGFSIVSPPSLPLILGSGQSSTLTVRFSPLSPGVKAGTVVISSNAGSGFVSLEANGLFPLVAVSPQTLNFGSVRWQESKELEFEISNIGTSKLTILEIAVSGTDFSVSTTQTKFQLLPGENTKAKATFEPKSPGEKSGNIIVRTDIAVVLVSLSGQGEFPELGLEPEILNFDKVRIGTRKTEEFYIKNKGSGVLKIESLEISGTGFELRSTDVFLLNPGESAKVEVGFSPQAVGLSTGSVSVKTNYGSGEVKLSGQGVSPFLLVNPSILDFGEVVSGSQKNLSFSIVNAGTYPLEVSGMGIEGEGFKFSDEISLPITIDEGESETINISFSPIKQGAHTGKAIIKTSYGEAYVSLQGEGLTSSLYFDPTTVNFGTVIVGKTKEFPLKVSNSGNWFVIIYEISLDSKDFKAEIPTTPFTMPPGDSRIVKVSFSPTSGGKKEGSIRFLTNFGGIGIKLEGYGRERACSCSSGYEPEGILNQLILTAIVGIFLLIRGKKITINLSKSLK